MLPSSCCTSSETRMSLQYTPLLAQSKSFSSSIAASMCVLLRAQRTMPLVLICARSLPGPTSSLAVAASSAPSPQRASSWRTTTLPRCLLAYLPACRYCEEFPFVRFMSLSLTCSPLAACRKLSRSCGASACRPRPATTRSLRRSTRWRPSLSAPRSLPIITCLQWTSSLRYELA